MASAATTIRGPNGPPDRATRSSDRWASGTETRLLGCVGESPGHFAICAVTQSSRTPHLILRRAGCHEFLAARGTRGWDGRPGIRVPGHLTRYTDRRGN